MRANTILFHLSLCLLSAICIHAQVPTEGMIFPGKSVAGVELGATLASFEKLFPKHPNTDEELPVNSCGIGGYHWVDVDRGATGIYAYTKGEVITQFSVKTPRFALQNGTKVGSSESEVKRAYPQGKPYILRHSNSAVMGGRDLIYWVDRQGVAFELYWNRKKSERFVSGIEVFYKSTEYLPEGCISVPQQWSQMK